MKPGLGDRCTHSGLVGVLTIGRCTVYAGTKAQAWAEWPRARLAISLIGWDGLPPEQAQAAMVHDDGRAIFKPVRWPNFKAPWHLGTDFWLRLVEQIGQVDGSGLLYCMGGHGRTGTALTVLAKLTGACGQDEPIAWVRRTYCQEAVETAEQVAYLRWLGITEQEG